MYKLNASTLLITLVMAAAVTACGGGGGGTDVGAGGSGAPGAPPSETSGVPPSAVASVDGLVAFMNQLIDTGTNDSSEPILLGDASLPVDDTI